MDNLAMEATGEIGWYLAEAQAAGYPAEQMENFLRGDILLQPTWTRVEAGGQSSSCRRDVGRTSPRPFASHSITLRHNADSCIFGCRMMGVMINK